MVWPNGSASIPSVSSEFNPSRRNPVTGVVQPHQGIDLVGWDVVRAPFAGTIILARYNGGYGNQVQIRRPNGDVVSLAHNRAFIRTGGSVSEGEPVAYMGSTGQSTGKHSHYETRPGGGSAINPRTYMSRNQGAGGTNPDGSLVVDGEWGSSTTSKLQAVLGVARDGELGPITIRALQGRLGVAQDGEIGPETTRALQARVGAPVDGELGPETVKALQRHLNAGGTLAPPAVPGRLEEDGELGPATVSKLQAVVGAPVDGDWGPATTSKLQAALGVPVDGELGPVTIKALQANVGATQDGEIGPDTIRKLQAFLNAGRTFSKVATPAPVDPPVTPPVTPPNADNPRGLPTHTPFYPGAFIGLDAPLGDAPRGQKGTPPVPVSVIIDQFHIHRTGSNGDDGDWFSYRNSRSSCPHLHVLQDGRTREFIRPKMKPALSGPEWNWRGYGIEIQGAGDGTPEQFERVADIMAWLASYEGRELDGVLVTYHLRQRAGVTVTHREMVATECPGDWWVGRVDALLERARVLFKEKYSPAEPEPEPEPEHLPAPIRSSLERIHDELGDILGR